MRHYFSLTCHSVQRARQPLSRRAISLGSFTVAGDFVLQLIHRVSKVLGANYKRAIKQNVADKFAMCTDMK